MKLIYTTLLLLSTLVSISKQNHAGSGFTAEVIPRDSPLSPSFSPSRSIEAPLKPYLDSVYLMKFYIGTPPVEQFVVIDTLSNLTIIQCFPYKSSHKQTPPIHFIPKKSKTYRIVPCGSPQCTTIDPDVQPSCGAKNRCRFTFSSLNGYVSKDALTFPEINASFPGMVFGCLDMSSITSSSDPAVGILGLANGRISIIRQLNPLIKGKFSYCLPPLTSNATGKIRFGSDAVVSGPGTVTTPIVKSVTGNYYFVALEAVSVGHHRIKYPRSSGSVDPGGNVMIDSGMTVTILDRQVVKKMEEVMARLVKGERTKNYGDLNLCYKKVGNGGLKAPRVTFHFRGGGDVVTPDAGVFLKVEEGILCFSYMGVRKFENEKIGNLNQMNYEVGFDLVKKMVSFKPADCSK